RAAHQRRAAGGVVGVFGERPHERQVDMHVRVNKPGENVFASGFDHLSPRRGGEVGADPRDRFPFAPNVGPVARVSGDDLAVFDKQWHERNSPQEACKLSEIGTEGREERKGKNEGTLIYANMYGSDLMSEDQCRLTFLW